MNCSICEYNKECKNVNRELRVGDWVLIKKNNNNHSGLWADVMDVTNHTIHKIQKIENTILWDCGNKTYKLDIGYFYCGCWLKKVDYETMQSL